VAVPVQIVSGFLGAGKTTAIRAQLDAHRGERVAVIVNDFGEARIDGSALAEDEPFRIVDIPGGCVCCTAPEGFVEALGAVLAERPDRLLIEPTGLARPQDLIDTIRRCPHRDALALQPLVVLVDPAALRRLEADGGSESLALLREQAEAADVLVANKSDLASADDLARFRRFAGELWPAPLVISETRQAAIDPALLVWPDGEGPRADAPARPRGAGADPHPDHAHSSRGFRARSFRWSPEVVFARERLLPALEGLIRGEAGAPLARLKGVFRTLEGTARIEVAGGRLHEQPSSHRRDSRADAIIEGDGEAALDRIGDGLAGAILDPSELALDANRIELVLPGGAVHAVDREALRALPDPVPDVSLHFPKRAGVAARVGALLERVGAPGEGVAVVVAGDGFAAEPVALDVLRQGVLVHSLEGQPLPQKQGGPFRLLIPESASPEPVSCGNVKGVAKIVVRA
jgi:G3E family GTPase